MPLPNSRPPQGSGFTNIQQIIDANKNNHLGQALAGGVSGAAQGAVNDLNSNYGNFINRIGDLSQQRLQGQQTANNILNKVQTDPNTLTDADYNNFAKYRDYSYGGPKNFEQGNQLLTKAKDAEQLGRYTTSEPGRGELLRRFVGVGGPQYTQANQREDQLLLGNQGAALKGIRRETLGLGQRAAGQVQSAEAQRSAEEQAANALGTGLKNQIGTQTSGIATGLQNRATEYGAAQTAAQGALQNALTSGQLTEAQATQLGLSPASFSGENGLRTFGVNAMDYVTPQFAPTTSSVASVNERAQLAALAKLGGTNQTTVDPNAPMYDPTKPLTFDSQNFMNRIYQQGQNYNQDVNNARVDLNSGAFNPDTSLNASSTEPLLQRITRLQQFQDPRLDEYSRYKREYEQAQQQLKDIQHKDAYDQYLKLT